MVYVSFSLCNNQFRTRYCEIVIQIGARPPPWFPVYSRNHNDLSSSCPCWLAWWHDPSPANLRGLSLLLTMFFSGWVHCICLFKFKIGQKDTKRPNEDYLDSTHAVPAPSVMAATYRNISSPNVPGQLPLPSRIPPPPPDFLVFSLLCPEQLARTFTTACERIYVLATFTAHFTGTFPIHSQWQFSQLKGHFVPEAVFHLPLGLLTVSQVMNDQLPSPIVLMACWTH